jgi:hypothetical protein
MYCDSLGKCLASTVTAGIRSRGGLGDNLVQLKWGEPGFFFRWEIDVGFAVLVNILLIKVFFAFVVDSFSAKRVSLA